MRIKPPEESVLPMLEPLFGNGNGTAGRETETFVKALKLPPRLPA